MKIGVWLGDEVANTVGGAFAYMSRFINLIDNYQFDEAVELCYLSWIPQYNLKKDVVNISQLPSWIYRLLKCSRIAYKFATRLDGYVIRKYGLNKVLGNTGVKVVLYIHQCTCIDPQFPFISINWDIGHRSTYAFPELTYNNAFENREAFYMKVMPKALLVICESETGKMELINLTRIGAHRLRIMPIFSGPVASLNLPLDEMEQILKAIGVEKNCFFYYPAQFWAHKNHIGLLKAFKEFIEHENRYFRLVLSGTDKGNKEYVKQYAHKLGILDNVIFLGFVSEETVYSLYKNATALVMASHFGPTNMPPIEAMELGCPVICSDIGGHKEILGDNAVFFNSFDYSSIYHAMKEVAYNRDNQVNNIEKQRMITRFNADSALKSLNEILKEAVTIRENWN